MERKRLSPCSDHQEDQGRLQAEMEAKLAEKDAEIDIQQRELQTLRVCNCINVGFCAVTVS